MTYDLRGKVVLITGAAGGIGAASARSLYETGSNLVLTDVTQAAVDELAGRFASCDAAEFERIIEVDLFGVWRTIKASLPEVIRNQGQVLITASIYAFMNGMINSPYAASKAAIEMLGRALRSELAGTGASASVLYPGWIATPLAKVAFGGNETATRLVELAYPKFLRQPIQPEVVAEAVVRGLSKRRPRIVVPSRWAPFSMMRGVFNALTDGYVVRNDEIIALVRKFEQ